MTRLHADGMAGTLSAAASNVATSLQSAAFASLPVIAGGDTMVVVLDPASVDGPFEKILVGAHASGSSTISSVTRGYEDSTPRSHASGTPWLHGPVASDIGGGSQVGTWDAMQASTPANGERWFAIDQGVDYVGVDGEWVRTTGNAKDIWVTDYGWKCDNQTYSASGNVAALRAAIDAARSLDNLPQSRGTRKIFIPEAPDFVLAYVNESINVEKVTLVGVGGSHRVQFGWEPMVAIQYYNPSAGAEPLFYTNEFDGGINGCTFHNIWVIGHNRGFESLQGGTVLARHSKFSCNKTDHPRNHGLVLENTFWVNIEKTSIAITSNEIGTRFPLGLYCVDGDNIGHAVAQAYFTDVQLINGNIYCESDCHTTEGGSSGDVKFIGVVSENSMNQPFFTYRNIGTKPTGLQSWIWEHCVKADSAPSIGEAMFDLDGGGNNDSFTGWTLRGNLGDVYVIKATNLGTGSVTGWDVGRLAQNQELIDPASDAKIYGMRVGGSYGAGWSVRSKAATMGDAANSHWKNGYQDPGFRVGRAFGDTHARGMWTADGRLCWGPGSGVVDTMLYRDGVASVVLGNMSGSDGTFAVAKSLYYERSDPSAPAGGGAYVYARDNGAGKTQLCVRFNTGAVQVIATEP